MYVCCECFCQVEVSATGWSLVQRSRTECGVPEFILGIPDNQQTLAQYNVEQRWNKFLYKHLPSSCEFLENRLSNRLTLIATVNFAVYCQYFLADTCVCVCVCVCVCLCVCVCVKVMPFCCVQNFTVNNIVFLGDTSTINCRKGSIYTYFYKDKIRATPFSGNADSCAFGTVLAYGNY